MTRVICKGALTRKISVLRERPFQELQIVRAVNRYLYTLGCCAEAAAVCGRACDLELFVALLPLCSELHRSGNDYRKVIIEGFPAKTTRSYEFFLVVKGGRPAINTL